MDQTDRAAAWDARVAGLVEALPDRVARAVRWLRDPSRRAVRIASGLLLVVGGCLSILPVLGLWMLPPASPSWPTIGRPSNRRLEGAALFFERSWSRFRRP